MRQRVSALLSAAVAGGCLAALGCGHEPQVTAPPYQPVTTVAELMQSVIGHAAAVYWNSVQVTVDATGEHERSPQTDEEWEAVWAAALTIAESGNLLMMAPRAVDDGAWMEFSRSLVDAGVAAAAAAEAHDVERVFAAGEQVYLACSGCHERYGGGIQTEPPAD